MNGRKELTNSALAVVSLFYRPQIQKYIGIKRIGIAISDRHRKIVIGICNVNIYF